MASKTIVATTLLLSTSTAFSPQYFSSHSYSSSSVSSALKVSPSVVTDPDGPTPIIEPDPFPTVDIDQLPESHYDPDNHPIPHQPWRRGDTDGCHDPLSAPWRLEAESIISDAVAVVGGKVEDVTWYMAKCVISINEQSLSDVVSYTDGPEVRVVYPEKEDISGHVFEDPDVGTDNEYFTEEDELLDFEQYDEETEYEILKANMPEEFDEATGEPLPPREPRSREERAIEIEEEWTNRWLDEPREEKPADGMFSHPVDTKALSVVSQAIITALEDENVEKKLQILSRHDIVLTSPLDNPCILDSQKEFDAARDLDVYVETRDPWGSNRVLGGKLVDRNAMDVIINQDNSGRMVTIPNSMVHQVLLPSGLAKGNARMRAALDAEDDEDEDDEEDWDVEEADIDEEEFLE
jgi:ribosome maturation factor RimP